MFHNNTQITETKSKQCQYRKINIKINQRNVDHTKLDSFLMKQKFYEVILILLSRKSLFRRCQSQFSPELSAVTGELNRFMI